MALITEEPPPPLPPSNPTKPSQNSPSTQTPNPFTFWFHFTLLATLLTLLLLTLSPLLSPQDPKSWFLSLPSTLRHHYSAGRTIKIQLTPNQNPIEVFTLRNGPTNSPTVLLVHGLGCSSYSFKTTVESLARRGLQAVAVDLPGSGFSDKSMVVAEEGPAGALTRVWEVYSEIREKGLFWGFDQLVEKGYVDFEGNDDDARDRVRVRKREVVKGIELGSEEMGRVLGQVVDSMGLAPVDLVLHDSALGLGANWVSKNPGLVRSITLLDTTSVSPALPLWVLRTVVVRELVLGFGFLFGRVLESCCWKKPVGGGGSEVEAHRVLLKGRDGRRSVVAMGMKMNCSFDLAEWGRSEGVKGLPMQVVWSGGWSEEWSKEGRRVASGLPQALFVSHSGGRWPQDNAADDIAESIFQFLSTLPKSVRQSDEEPIPDHIQKIDESRGSDHHHPHPHHDVLGGHDHGHGHDHANAAGYMDAYGLGHGWAG